MREEAERKAREQAARKAAEIKAAAEKQKHNKQQKANLNSSYTISAGQSAASNHLPNANS